MAHRLPRAGIKSKDSERFAFYQVSAPPPKPGVDLRCCEKDRVGACLLRPKFVMLRSRSNEVRCTRGKRAGLECCGYESDGIRIRCCCRDTDSAPVRQSFCQQPSCPPAIRFSTPSYPPCPCEAPPTSIRKKIIVLQAPCETVKAAGVATKRDNMIKKNCCRSREVPMVQESVCSSTNLVEFLAGPNFTDGDGCDVLTLNRDPCKSKSYGNIRSSLEDNCCCDSDAARYSLYDSGEDQDRCLVHVRPRDCRPKCVDYRRVSYFKPRQ